MGCGLCCGWLQCTMYLLYWARSVLLVCRNCGDHEQCWVCMVYGLYGVQVMLWNFIARMLLNMVGMDRWKTGVSNAEYLVHLLCINRLRACRVVWCCYLFLLFFFSVVFLYCCLRRGGRGGWREDAWFIKYDNVQLRNVIKFPVNPNNGGIEAQAKPKAP